MNEPVSEVTPILFPALGAPFAVHGIGRRKVGRFGLRQVAVKVGPVRLFQARAQPATTSHRNTSTTNEYLQQQQLPAECYLT